MFEKFKNIMRQYSIPEHINLSISGGFSRLIIVTLFFPLEYKKIEAQAFTKH